MLYAHCVKLQICKACVSFTLYFPSRDVRTRCAFAIAAEIAISLANQSEQAAFSLVNCAHVRIAESRHPMHTSFANSNNSMIIVHDASHTLHLLYRRRKTRRHCYPVLRTTPWRPARCATRWILPNGCRRAPGWRLRAKRRNSHARMPRCCCRSCSRPRRQRCNAACRIRATPACGVITRDTSIVTCERRLYSATGERACTTQAHSTCCNKRCPSDKSETKVLIRSAFILGVRA